MSCKNLTMNLMVLCILLSPDSHTCAQQATRPDRSKVVLEEFRIHNDGDAILLPVKFNGEVYQFVLDTGSTLNVYDRSLEPHLGAALTVVTAETPTGTTKMPLFSSPKAMIGSLSLKTPEPVACANFDMLRRVGGHDIRGFIGMAFLAQHVVEIDFDQGRLSFLSAAPPESGLPVRFSLADRPMPAVYAEIEGLGLKKFRIDTGDLGFGSGDLEARDFDLLAEQKSLRLLRSGISSDLGRTLRVKRGRVMEARVQEYRIKGAIFCEGKIASLGLNYWRRFNIIFDCPNNLMYLRESRQFHRTDVVDLSGLHLFRQQEQIVVDVVDDRSAASTAGIQTGDVVLKIDGTEANAMRLHVLRLRLSSVGSPVLIVRRGERVFDATLRLRGDPDATIPPEKGETKSTVHREGR
jgi:PDZ domain/Aspartyl protease